MSVACSHISSEKRKASEQALKEAFKEIVHEMIPVRAHGLSVLKTLVLSKDEVAMEKIESIISVFLDQLEDNDRWG